MILDHPWSLKGWTTWSLEVKTTAFITVVAYGYLPPQVWPTTRSTPGSSTLVSTPTGWAAPRKMATVLPPAAMLLQTCRRFFSPSGPGSSRRPGSSLGYCLRPRPGPAAYSFNITSMDSTWRRLGKDDPTHVLECLLKKSLKLSLRKIFYCQFKFSFVVIQFPFTLFDKCFKAKLSWILQHIFAYRKVFFVKFSASQNSTNMCCHHPILRIVYNRQ